MSSFFEYKDRGFWSADSYVQLLLFMLQQEIDSMPAAPDWLRKIQSDWHDEATNGVRGMVTPDLDGHLGTDPERIKIALTLASQVGQRLVEYAPAIPRDVVNTFGTGVYSPTDEPRAFLADVPTDVLISDIDKVIALLSGGPVPGDHFKGRHAYRGRRILLPSPAYLRAVAHHASRPRRRRWWRRGESNP